MPLTRAAAAAAAILYKTPRNDQPDSRTTPGTARTRRASAPAPAIHPAEQADDFSSEQSASDAASQLARELASENPSALTDGDEFSVVSVTNEPARQFHPPAQTAPIPPLVAAPPHGPQGPQAGGAAPGPGFYAHAQAHSAAPMGVYPAPWPFQPGPPQLVPHMPYTLPPGPQPPFWGYSPYLPPVPPVIQPIPAIPGQMQGTTDGQPPAAPATQPALRLATSHQASEVHKMLLNCEHLLENHITKERSTLLRMSRALNRVADMCDGWGITPPIHSLAGPAIDVAAELIIIANGTPPYSEHVPAWLRHLQDADTAAKILAGMGPRHWAAIFDSLICMSAIPDDSSGKAKSNDRGRVTALIAVALGAQDLSIQEGLRGAEPDEVESVELAHNKMCSRLRKRGFGAEVDIHLVKPLRSPIPNLRGKNLNQHLILQYAKLARTIDRAAADRLAVAGSQPANRTPKEDSQSKPSRDRRKTSDNPRNRGQARRDQAEPAAVPPPQAPPATTADGRIRLVDSAFDYTPEGADAPGDARYQCKRCGSGKHFASACPCPKDRQHKIAPNPPAQQGQPRGPRRAGGQQ
jgi:hypothetical protein